MCFQSVGCNTTTKIIDLEKNGTFWHDLLYGNFPPEQSRAGNTNKQNIDAGPIFTVSRPLQCNALWDKVCDMRTAGTFHILRTTIW